MPYLTCLHSQNLWNCHGMTFVGSILIWCAKVPGYKSPNLRCTCRRDDYTPSVQFSLSLHPPSCSRRTYQSRRTALNRRWIQHDPKRGTKRLGREIVPELCPDNPRIAYHHTISGLPCCLPMFLPGCVPCVLVILPHITLIFVPRISLCAR